MRNHRAFTLTEMLVVLAILSVTTLVAIQATDSLVEQSRHETTRQTLDHIRGAIVGDPTSRHSDGTPRVTGFVTDTGRLPMIPAPLDELLLQPATLIPHAVQTFDSDRDGSDDVSLSSGWNGPYLRLGAGSLEIVDGWGRTPVVTTGPPFVVSSLGADGNSDSPEEGFDADIGISIDVADYSANVVFRLFQVDANSSSRLDPAPTGNQRLGVLFYAPNAAGGTDGAIQEQLLVVPYNGHSVTGQPINLEHTRSETLTGQVAARAILWSDANSNDQLDSGESITQKSYVHHLTIVPGANRRVEMELR